MKAGWDTSWAGRTEATRSGGGAFFPPFRGSGAVNPSTPLSIKDFFEVEAVNRPVSNRQEGVRFPKGEDGGIKIRMMSRIRVICVGT